MRHAEAMLSHLFKARSQHFLTSVLTSCLRRAVLNKDLRRQRKEFVESLGANFNALAFLWAPAHSTPDSRAEAITLFQLILLNKFDGLFANEFVDTMVKVFTKFLTDQEVPLAMKGKG